MHEFVISALNQKNRGIKALDIQTIHPNQNFESSVDGVGRSTSMSRGSIGNIKSVNSGVSNSVKSLMPGFNDKFLGEPLSYRTPTACGCFIRFDFILKSNIKHTYRRCLTRYL